MKFIKSLTLGVALFLQAPAFAGPWVEVGDSWLRSDIELLAQKGHLNVPLTTWPVMWSNIKRGMERAMEPKTFAKLSKLEQDALVRLKRAFRKQTGDYSEFEVSVSSDAELFRDFQSVSREESSIRYGKHTMGDQWALNIELEYVHDPFVMEGQSEKKYRYDGSYFATIYENFSVGYGLLDHWWGPGWDSSLILSNNARPSPGVILQRNYSDAFETPWLSWLGEWTYTGFATVLNDTRVVTDAKLLGFTLAFMPVEGLEIGLRRTAQYGGEGRPESLSTLFDLIIGSDNCGSNGIGECTGDRDNEPGNQLAAIDVNWHMPFEHPYVLYAQVMGEDEAGLLPAKKAHLFGLSSVFEFEETQNRVYVEYSDTTTNFSTGQLNVIYNHSLYQSGYRYYGRSLASTYDNDSEVLTLGLISRVDEQQRFQAKLRNAKLNVDDTSLQRTTFLNKTDVTLLSVHYEYSFQYVDMKVDLEHTLSKSGSLDPFDQSRIGISFYLDTE